MSCREEMMEIFEGELQSADAMGDVFNEYDPDTIGDECLGLTKDLLENAEDDLKKKVIIETAGKIAQAIGDEELARFSVAAIEQVENGQS